MRHLSIYALILFAVCSVASCKSGKPAASVGGRTVEISAVAAQRTPYADTVDFGRIRPGEKVTKEIFLGNTGEAAVALTDIRTSCGCVSFQYNRQPVMPGERKSMEIIFDSRGYYGEIDKNVYLHTTITSAPITLLVRAKIE